MKVLLFVQTGDARPKCVAWDLSGRASCVEFFSGFRRWERVRERPHRWWLVECESAEAGRRLIEADDGERFAMGSRYGRILASGGKR